MLLVGRTVAVLRCTTAGPAAASFQGQRLRLRLRIATSHKLPSGSLPCGSTDRAAAPPGLLPLAPAACACTACARSTVVRHRGRTTLKNMHLGSSGEATDGRVLLWHSLTHAWAVMPPEPPPRHPASTLCKHHDVAPTMHASPSQKGRLAAYSETQAAAP